MTEQMTPVGLPTRQVELEEKPEDTPRSIDVGRLERSTTARGYTNALLVMATATQILGSSDARVTDYLFNSKDMTRLSDEGPLSQRADFFVSYPPSNLDLNRESDAEATNRTRLELLARLYVSKKLSAEEDARLAIVTEKVRRLIPRITAEDFEMLGSIAQESETIRVKNEHRRRRLRI